MDVALATFDPDSERSLDHQVREQTQKDIGKRRKKEEKRP